MYGISKTKMINPAHIVSVEYHINKNVNSDGKETGHIAIQMSNQKGRLAYKIDDTCENCELIIQDLVNLVKITNQGSTDTIDLNMN